MTFVNAVKSNARPGTQHHRHIKPVELDTLPTPRHWSTQGHALAVSLVKLPTEIMFHGVELEQCGANRPASSTTIEQVTLTTKKILSGSCPGLPG